MNLIMCFLQNELLKNVDQWNGGHAVLQFMLLADSCFPPFVVASIKGLYPRCAGKGHQNTKCTDLKVWTVALCGHVFFGYVGLEYLLYNYYRLMSKYKFVDKCSHKSMFTNDYNFMLQDFICKPSYYAINSFREIIA